VWPTLYLPRTPEDRNIRSDNQRRTVGTFLCRHVRPADPDEKFHPSLRDPGRAEPENPFPWPAAGPPVVRLASHRLLRCTPAVQRNLDGPRGKHRPKNALLPGPGTRTRRKEACPRAPSPSVTRVGFFLGVSGGAQHTQTSGQGYKLVPRTGIALSCPAHSSAGTTFRIPLTRWAERFSDPHPILSDAPYLVAMPTVPTYSRASP